MIPTDTPHLQTTGLTDPGSTGKNNEDRYGLASFRLNETDPTPVLFAMVADGIGGKQAGELAAEIAVETVLGAVSASDGSDPIGTMRAAILESNRRIIARAGEKIDNHGMGTTATCAWVTGNRLYAANVGNSRLYLLRGSELRRISIDHSWVQEAMDIGLLTPEQAKKHPNARIITRHLGSDSLEPDFRLQMDAGEKDEQMVENQGLELLPNDLLLLCSDGLSDVVEDPEIEAALLAHAPADALRQLTDLANERGGPDNITSVAIVVPESPVSLPEKEAPAKPQAAPKQPENTSLDSSPRLAVMLLSIFILVVLILIGWALLPGIFP